MRTKNKEVNIEAPYETSGALAIELPKIELARRSLWEFTRFTFPDFIPNWHHYKICAFLEDVFAGKIKKGMIFMPPRHGKSELATTRLPAYALGRNPNEQIIQCSYGSDLANKLNRNTQRVISSPRYQMVFPETKLPGMEGVPFERNSIRTSEYFDIAGAKNKGYYRSAGVGGGITGMGATLGIIDDPYKDRQEADSERHRETVWDWYWSTFMTRLEKDPRILVILTRWHDADLAGRLLKEEGDEWQVLKLPALKEGPPTIDDPREDGMALWPWKRSRANLLNLRKKSARDWASLWQQDPVIGGGNIIKAHWWKYYHELPKHFSKQIMVVDASFKDSDDSDYVVIQTWGRVKVDKYLLDQFRDKMGFTETMRAIERMLVKWPDIRQVWIEDKANGTAIIEVLQSKLSGVKRYEPKGSKESRVYAITDQIEGGNTYLPHPSIAPWIGDYVEEHTRFPKGANDDQVDGTSMALDILGKDERSSFYRLATS